MPISRNSHLSPLVVACNQLILRMRDLPSIAIPRSFSEKLAFFSSLLDCGLDSSRESFPIDSHRVLSTLVPLKKQRRQLGPLSRSPSRRRHMQWRR